MEESISKILELGISHQGTQILIQCLSPYFCIYLIE